jgi:hypothetical protein
VSTSAFTIGIALRSRSSAEWVELALSADARARPVIVDPQSALPEGPFDLLVVEGRQPGATLLHWCGLYSNAFGVRPMVVLGDKRSTVLSNLAWSESTTIFVQDEKSIEALRDAVENRLAALAAAASAETAEKQEHLDPNQKSKRLGYLSSLHVGDLIQMLCMNQWTGCVDVEELATGRRGQIFINGGILVHSLTPAAEGEQACLEMLGWTRCQYRFDEEFPLSPQTIFRRWDKIIFEAAIMRDESEGKAVASGS